MLRFWFGLALTGLLVAFSLPLIAICRIFAGPDSMAASFPPGFRRRRRVDGFDDQKLWASDEFGFEHALQAYEELIDAHVSTATTKTCPWEPRSTPMTKTCPWGPRWRPM